MKRTKTTEPSKGTEILENPGATPLELNGKSYSLIYDFDSVVAAEELTGIGLVAGVDWSNITVRRVQAMLYASLLKMQPQITMEEIRSLITIANIAKIEKALASAWIKPSD